MKKLFIVFMMLLAGCQKQPDYYLYLYYSISCPACKSFINLVIPELEKEYGSRMLITKYNIDDEQSLDNYARTCSLLEDYYIDDNSGSVPLIVLDGYFAQFGYNIEDDQLMIKTIRDSIAEKDILDNAKEIYLFKAGKTFHKGGN